MKKLNDDELKKVDGGAKRPAPRKRHVTGKGKGLKRRGTGLGTGPVGRR